MSNHIATYLNDHLAGSESAIELLRGLENAYPDTSEATLASSLREEFADEQRQLREVMQSAGIGVSTLRKVAGMIGSKLSELKLTVDDHASGKFRLLESLEMVSVGIAGKRLLWHALECASKTNERLAVLDYRALEAQAKNQRERIESLRIQNAVALFH